MDSKLVAREIAENSAVLLKNDGGLLPLEKGKTAAFFGRTQLETVLSGNGSGAANTKDPKCILDECEKAGIVPEETLAAFYREKIAALNANKAPVDFDFEKLKELVHSGMIYELFGKYTPPAEEFAVDAGTVGKAAAATDTAVLVIGRASGGEECDRHLYDDYYLTEAENALVETVCASFPKVAVILNINGIIDLSWVETHPSIQSVLFVGVPGEEGPTAVANLLCGNVTPSGKLSFTVAKKYEDYPAHANFSWDKDHPETIKTYADYGLDAKANGSDGFAKSPVTVYEEDVYLGYRYFETFGVEPLYPFGFGLSYTTFEVTPGKPEKAEGGVKIAAAVKNTGALNGREVVQLYVSARCTKDAQPASVLKDFAKTGVLAPGETETVEIFVPWRELATYSEADAGWIIEKGAYVLRVGTSSAETEAVGRVNVEADICAEKTANRLGLRDCNRGKIDFMKAERAGDCGCGKDCILTLDAADVAPYKAPAVPETAVDWSKFSVKELASLCVGFGPGTPFAGLAGGNDPKCLFDANGEPLTSNTHPVGHDGYVSPAIEKKGIRSVFYKDGPAGVGVTAWPSEMLLACSFDTALCRKFGDAAGQECEDTDVDVWLAPAVNLQRHPLGGRNFEYLSEDPFLSAACAVAEAKGVQENHPVLVCAKHFAVNEQETYRRGSTKKSYDAVDSILTERAVRELYLKPFERLVKEAGLRCIMTSFNRINGTFAGGNKDLCTHILREEWGFDGVVVTDWGDMDTVVDGADAVAAGNDVVMPGGPPVIAQILDGYKAGRVTLGEMQKAVQHLLSMVKRFGRYEA